MKVSEFGLAIIRQFEGLRLYPYKDDAGFQTIGFGHKIRSKESFSQGIDEATAEMILLADIVTPERVVSTACRAATQNQFDAMVSLTFNIGSGRFLSSDVLRHFRAGDLESAAKAFSHWRLAGGKINRGLVARRAREAALFKTP